MTLVTCAHGGFAFHLFAVAPQPRPVADQQVLRPDGSETALPRTDGSAAAALVCIAFRAGAEVGRDPDLTQTLTLDLAMNPTHSFVP